MLSLSVVKTIKVFLLSAVAISDEILPLTGKEESETNAFVFQDEISIELMHALIKIEPLVTQNAMEDGG
jgi:hypothetical protein